jgi:hypothetical protein
MHFPQTWYSQYDHKINNLVIDELFGSGAETGRYVRDESSFAQDQGFCVCSSYLVQPRVLTLSPRLLKMAIGWTQSLNRRSRLPTPKLDLTQP